MKRAAPMILMIAALSLIALTAQARTVISDKWKDKDFTGPVKKIVVFCIMHDRAGRILFEDEFVRQVKARGINALPGYIIIPQDKFVEKDAALAKMRSLGADVILSTRLIDKVAMETALSGPGPNDPREPGFYGYVYDPGTRGDSEPAYLETNLIDLKTERRVWTARSKTKVEVVNKELIVDYIELMIDKLVSDKMIK